MDLIPFMVGLIFFLLFPFALAVHGMLKHQGRASHVAIGAGLLFGCLMGWREHSHKHDRLSGIERRLNDVHESMEMYVLSPPFCHTSANLTQAEWKLADHTYELKQTQTLIRNLSKRMIAVESQLPGTPPPPELSQNERNAP